MSIQQAEPVGFVVTLKDVYDQMQAGFNQVQHLSGQLTSIINTQAAADQHRADLEARVRILEAAKGRMWGAMVVLGVLFGGGGVWAAISLLGR